MTKYYMFDCQLGTQFAYINNDGSGYIETGFGFREIEDDTEREKILQRYIEITEQEFKDRFE